MSSLLKGIHVVVVGSSRPLLVCAQWFRDLGAHVQVRGDAVDDPVDRLWLGVSDDVTDVTGEAEVDLVVREHGADSSGVSAPVTVTYTGSGSHAPEPHARLDGRSLAAVGGVAVAVGEVDRAALPLPEGCLEHMIGSHLAAAACAALLEGTSHVEVSGVDVVAWSVATNANLYVPYGVDWHRAGRRANGSGGGYPYGLFDVADGQFCLIGRTAKDWEVLVRAMGAPAWTDEPRYQDRRLMAQSYPDEVDARLAPWLQRLTRAELVDLAAEFGFPGGPILRPDEVLNMPTLQDRWRESSESTSSGRRVKVPGPPFDTVMTPGSGTASTALRDLVVLDLSWVWSGPAVGVALADLGATVIKVESSTRPDNSRLRGQPTTYDVPPEAPATELSPYFHAVNRGKRSVSVNLATERGLTILQELAATADVIIENLSPGVMKRFGIAPDQVHAVNPDCVYLSLRGYRPHPSTAGLRAYAPVLTGGAGVESLVGYAGEPPTGMMTYGFSDANAASQGVLLALAALWARRERSCGTQITLSQLEAAVVANGHNLVGSQLPGFDPHLEPFAESDALVPFDRLPEAPWTSSDLFTTVSTPWLGDLLVSRLPWRMDGALPEVDDAGPVLGADTSAVLADRLGMTGDERAELTAAGILV